MAIEIGAFEPGAGNDELLRLRAKVWGADHPYNSTAYFDWMYQANPFGRSTGATLRRDGELIGFAGILERRMAVSGEVSRVAQVVDYMVDGGARQGVAGAYGLRVISEWVALARDRGFRFGIGFPNANSRRIALSPRVGWRATFSPALLVRPFARISPPAGKIGGLPPAVVAAGLATVAGWSGLSHALRVPKVRGQAVSIAAFGAGFDRLCASLGAVATCGNRPDARFLNWRYVDHPVNRYDLVGWEVGGEPRGYAATAQRQVFGVNATLLIDLAADAPEIEFALLGETLRRARSSGSAMTATLAIAGSPRYRRLLRAGFVAVPKRLDPKPFLFTTHGLGDDDVAQRIETAPWSFNWADMDAV